MMKIIKNNIEGATCVAGMLSLAIACGMAKGMIGFFTVFGIEALTIGIICLIMRYHDKDFG